jgi:succinyl-CoA synthetase beta subunit
MELEASKHDLAYIKLDGNIGCMVNGAGLAMATMDIIKLNGAFPPTSSTSAAARPRKRSPQPSRSSSPTRREGHLVNIFGGIMKCDIIADGIIAAAREVDLSVPLVVRLEGTNVEEGKAILAGSGLPIVSPTIWATPPARSSRRSARSNQLDVNVRRAVAAARKRLKGKP